MFEQIRSNQRRAALLVFGMALLLFAMGYAIGEIVQPGGGTFGILLAFGIWIVLTAVSWFQGDRILLSVSRARKIEKADHPVLFNVVEEMCIAAGIAKLPEIYIIDDASPNAFATGRGPDHSAVAVTSGLLELLTRDELQGVIAHELGHVRNRDVLYMTLVGVMMGAIVLLADAGRRHLFWGGGVRSRRSSGKGGGAQGALVLVAILLIVLAPVLGRLIYLALSRRREYLADASSALFTRYPAGLASALEKLGGANTRVQAVNPATAGMFIVNPLKAASAGLMHLTSTHPPIAERVAILRKMAGQPDLRAYEQAFVTVTGRAVGVSAFAAGASVPSPAETLGLGAVILPATATAAGPQAVVERVRETENLLWHLDGYLFIACSCETTLKIPPVHQGRAITCPHCGRTHRTER